MDCEYSETGESRPASERDLTDAELEAWWRELVELESRLPSVLSGPCPDWGPEQPAPAQVAPGPAPSHARPVRGPAARRSATS